MSAISQKSISGITSITTPASVDNQFTIHTNNTTEAFKLDHAGNIHIHNHVNTTGISSASNFKTGTSNLHSTGLNIFDLDVDGHTNLDNVSITGVTTFSHTGANQLVIKDSDTSGDAAHMRISFQDSGGTEKFFVGNSNSNGWLYLGSPSGQNNNIAFRVNGSDKFQVNAAGAYVNGDLTVNGTVDILDSIIHTGDTNTKIRFPSADTITFETAGSERLRIDSSGNVTISTGNLTIPDSIIHSGDTDTKIAFTDNQIDLQCAGSSRAYINNYALYIQTGFPLAFLASSGATPNIKSGGTNNQDLLFTTGTGNPTRLQITSAGQVLPGADDAQNLGSSTKRWANIYAADMHYSNEGSKNDVDGTWGNYTIQEGESDLFLLNNRNGKKYKFVLQEVS